MVVLKKYLIWFICGLSLLSALFYNQLNLKHIPKDKIRNGQTIRTHDDHSYLSAPNNFLEKGIWKDESPGERSYFLRPPGYGIFYLICLKLSGGEESALWCIKLFQLLLFSISVYWLFSIVLHLTENRTLSLVAASLYGITPFAIGFLYYTLTEGITPALLLLFVFLLFRASKFNRPRIKNINYLLASFVFSYLFIIRPVLGIFLVLIVYFIIHDYLKEGVRITLIKLVLNITLCFSFMLMWQYRNYQIAGEYVGLHPIYRNDNSGFYRPALKEYWKFVAGWAPAGSEVHSYMLPMWLGATNGDTSITYVHNAINTIPSEVVSHFGKEQLVSIFKQYQRSSFLQQSYYQNQQPMPKELFHEEEELISNLKILVSKFKKEFWIQYYITSPIKVFKRMAFHSNLSLHIFQNKYRGHNLMEIFRYFFYGIHSLCFVFLLISLLSLKRTDWKNQILSLTIFAYVFYLCFIQRGIEERYTLPILPLLLILVSYKVEKCLSILRR